MVLLFTTPGIFGRLVWWEVVLSDTYLPIFFMYMPALWWVSTKVPSKETSVAEWTYEEES